MPPLLLFIMAGGSGERFWPLSRKAKPKHLLKLVSSKTLLEETVLRLKPLAPRPSTLLILTNHEQVPGIRKALPRFPKNSLIPEPAKRDTAPAAALATALALRAHPDAVLALLPADAVIGKAPIFRAPASRRCPRCTQLPIFCCLGYQALLPRHGLRISSPGPKDPAANQGRALSVRSSLCRKAIFGESKDLPEVPSVCLECGHLCLESLHLPRRGTPTTARPRPFYRKVSQTRFLCFLPKAGISQATENLCRLRHHGRCEICSSHPSRFSLG